MKNIKRVITKIHDGDCGLQHTINCLIYDNVASYEACESVQVLLTSDNEYLVIISIGDEKS
jgi:hypothetical protein